MPMKILFVILYKKIHPLVCHVVIDVSSIQVIILLGLPPNIQLNVKHRAHFSPTKRLISEGKNSDGESGRA